MITETVDIVIASILAVAAIITPIVCIATDKKTYITPEKDNGNLEDR